MRPELLPAKLLNNNRYTSFVQRRKNEKMELSCAAKEKCI
jgi:hypothetical protein